MTLVLGEPWGPVGHSNCLEVLGSMDMGSEAPTLTKGRVVGRVMMEPDWVGRDARLLETEAEDLLGALGNDNVSQSWNRQHGDVLQFNLQRKK